MNDLKRKFKNDWRYTGQDRYLARKQLKFSHFSSQIREHDHCEFCFTKFSENEGDLHEGYCTLDNYHWICPKCYDDFKNAFEWELVD